MKKLLLSLGLLLVMLSAFGQNPASAGTTAGKGVSPLSTNSTNSTLTGAGAGLQPVTRAVVVGISDYQSPAIPDLQFAHRDAQAFADWLSGPAGGYIPADNLQLLLNQDATLARLTGALTWLIDESKPGDEAYIYFSGHGDVETKTDFQLGFLLPYDAAPQNYMAGAFSLYFLQGIISTLSNRNVRTIVVTDACHSGKLAGSDIGGAAITGANLAKQFAKEIKILSCAPNEYSVEGEQWGGGRGAFSFHLVNGLTGLADQNQDAAVNLQEIRRYLEDHVSPEVAPQTQTPQTVGLPVERVARVDEPSLNKLKVITASQGMVLKATDNRGLEEDVLAKADSNARATWLAFKQALAEKRLLAAAGTDNRLDADALYTLLLREKTLEPLFNTARRNLAVALQDEPQQALNALLESDPYETNRWQYNPAKYVEYPRYLQRSMELLGEGHFAYQALLVKKLYFEAYFLGNQMRQLAGNQRDSVRAEAKNRLLQALSLQPQAAYLYHGIARLHSIWDYSITYQLDSVTKYCYLASRFSPSWLLPWLDLSYEYVGVSGNVPEVESNLMQAYKINPESYLVLERLAWLRQGQNRLDESIEITEKMMKLNPDLFNGSATQGVSYFLKRDWRNAEHWFRKSLEISLLPLNWSHFYLAWVGYRTRRPEELNAHIGGKWLDTEARLHYNKAQFEADPDSVMADCLAAPDSALYPGMLTTKYCLLGKAWLEKNDLQKAREACLLSLTLDPTMNARFQLDYALLGAISARENHISEAEVWFQKALNEPQFYYSEDFLNREETLYLYARFLLDQNRLDEAETWFQKTNAYAYERGYLAYYGLALLAAKKGRNTAALDWLEKSLDHYYPYSKPILADPLFKKLRQTKRFKALLAKHFPSSATQKHSKKYISTGH